MSTSKNLSTVDPDQNNNNGMMTQDAPQPKTLGDCLLHMFKQNKWCDVEFIFEKSEDRIQAHQFVLKARSPVFDSLLMDRSDVGGMRSIVIKDFSPQQFRGFLHFVYSDKFEWSVARALELLPVATTYKVQPLVLKCGELLQGKTPVEFAGHVFEVAGKYKDLKLMKKAGEIMVKSLVAFSQHRNFLDIEEGTLMYLLKQDSLTFKEVDLFKLAVKWAKNQVGEGNEENKGKLREVLVNIIPCIRFTNMTPNEFASEVVPMEFLAVQDVCNVYSYFAGDKATRETLASVMKFSTEPRRTKKLEQFVSFCSFGSEMDAVTEKGGTPLKECLSFYVVKRSSTALYSLGSTGESFYSDKRPAIKGILINWPLREVSRSVLKDDTMNFLVCIKRCTGIVEELHMHTVFTTSIPECTPRGKSKIVVDPPVELISDLTYCITVEDKSLHHRNPQCSFTGGSSRVTCAVVEYQYSQNSGRTLWKSSVEVSLEGRALELKNIRKNYSLKGFSRSPYKNIVCVRGILVGLV